MCFNVYVTSKCNQNVFTNILFYSRYEPELHPGVTFKIKKPKATLKIFSTGSITVTGNPQLYYPQYNIFWFKDIAISSFLDRVVVNNLSHLSFSFHIIIYSTGCHKKAQLANGYLLILHLNWNSKYSVSFFNKALFIGRFTCC